MGGPMAGVTCAGLFEDQFKVEFVGFDGRVGPMQDVYGLWESSRGKFTDLLGLAATYH